MKAERRHDLQNNELAERLAVLIQKVGPQKNLIAGIIILVIVAFAAGSYLAGRGARDRAMGWANYFSIADSTNSEGFDSVAAAYAGTPAGDWAATAGGFRYLSEGARLAFTQPVDSQENYDKAKTAFQELIANASDPQLKSRAMIGLAQAHEGLGELDDAVNAYKSVVESYPDSVFAKMAAESQAALEKPSRKEWYTWFASQEPRSPLSDPTLNNINTLPSDPNINIPEAGSLIKPDGASSVSPIQLDPPSNAPDSAEATSDLLDFPESESTEDAATDSEASVNEDEAAVSDETEVELTPEDDASAEADTTLEADAAEEADSTEAADAESEETSDASDE